jgi:hypothetical protein
MTSGSGTFSLPRYVAALAVIGALTACGSGGRATTGQRTPSGAASADTAAVAREAVRCIRAHGLPNFPDLVYDQQSGTWTIPAGTQKPPRSVAAPCMSILDRLPGKKRQRPLSAADIAKLRRLAQCLRQHGLADWPDPNAEGEFPLPARLRHLDKRTMKPQLDACRQYFSGDGIRVTEDSSGG